MNYIHIFVEMKKPPRSKERAKRYSEVDITDENVALKEIIIPYVKGDKRILIGGSFVSSSDIEKMEVFSSTEDSTAIYNDVSAENDAQARRMAAQNVIGFGATTTVYTAIYKRAENITSKILRDAKASEV